jgi:hypothetical protein
LYHGECSAAVLNKKQYNMSGIKSITDETDEKYKTIGHE